MLTKKKDNSSWLSVALIILLFLITIYGNDCILFIFTYGKLIVFWKKLCKCWKKVSGWRPLKLSFFFFPFLGLEN